MKLLNKSIQSWGKIFSVILILSLLLSIVLIANHSSIQINIIIILLVFSSVFMLLIGEDTKSQLSTSNYIITETLDNISVNDLLGVNKKDLMLALDKYELYKQYKSYDTVQYRRYMNPVSIIQAILCNTDTITDHTAVIVDRTKRKTLMDRVESIGAYYKIGDTYLLRSLSALIPGKEVEIDIEYPVSYSSTINIHNEYTVTAQTQI